MKLWVKLFTEITRDPTMGKLTLAQKGIWMLLLALAGEIDHRDPYDESVETGRIDTIEGTAYRIRVDEDELREALQVMISLGMVHIEDDTVIISHYGERQTRPPSAQREAVLERVRRHRAARADLPEPPEDDRYDDLRTMMAGYGVIINTQKELEAWNKLRGRISAIGFEQVMEEAKANAKAPITRAYVKAIMDGCERENRMPGEWRGQTAEAVPSNGSAPRRFYNPLTEEIEEI